MMWQLPRHGLSESVHPAHLRKRKNHFRKNFFAASRIPAQVAQCLRRAGGALDASGSRLLSSKCRSGPLVCSAPPTTGAPNEKGTTNSSDWEAAAETAAASFRASRKRLSQRPSTSSAPAAPKTSATTKATSSTQISIILWITPWIILWTKSLPPPHNNSPPPRIHWVYTSI